jgi:membrane-associated phospholipid phosphatase
MAGDVEPAWRMAEPGVANQSQFGERLARPAVAPALRRSAAILAVLGTLLVAVPAVVYADGTEPGRLDRWIQSVVENTPSAARTATLTVDWTGGLVGRPLVVLAVVALCLIAGRRRLAATAMVGSILTSVLATILKDVVGRRIHDDFLAYPSGHTAAATAIGVVLGLLLADLLRVGRVLGASMVLGPAVVGGAVMAWAQIDLTAHYPTDTIGGFGSALLVIPATALLVDKLAETRRTSPPG